MDTGQSPHLQPVQQNLGLWIWLFSLKCCIGNQNGQNSCSLRTSYAEAGLPSPRQRSTDISSWAPCPLVGERGMAPGGLGVPALAFGGPLGQGHLFNPSCNIAHQGLLPCPMSVRAQVINSFQHVIKQNLFANINELVMHEVF